MSNPCQCFCGFFHKVPRPGTKKSPPLAGTRGRSGLGFDLAVEPAHGLGQAAQLVDQPFLHGAPPVQDGAHVHDQLAGVEHQLVEAACRHLTVALHKAGDPLLHLLEPAHGLGHPQDHPRMAHRVDGHGGGGHDEAAPGADRQRDADGVPAPQHQRGAGLGDAGDQLGQGQPGLHIAPHRVQQDQQPLDGGVLLDGHQLGDDVLILGGLLALGGLHVPLDLADDGQTVDGVGPFGQADGAHGLQLLLGKGAALGLPAAAVGLLCGCLRGVFGLFLVLFVHLRASFFVQDARDGQALFLRLRFRFFGGRRAAVLLEPVAGFKDLCGALDDAPLFGGEVGDVQRDGVGRWQADGIESRFAQQRVDGNAHDIGDPHQDAVGGRPGAGLIERDRRA